MEGNRGKKKRPVIHLPGERDKDGVATKNSKKTDGIGGQTRTTARSRFIRVLLSRSRTIALPVCRARVPTRRGGRGRPPSQGFARDSPWRTIDGLTMGSWENGKPQSGARTQPGGQAQRGPRPGTHSCQARNDRQNARILPDRGGLRSTPGCALMSLRGSKGTFSRAKDGPVPRGHNLPKYHALEKTAEVFWWRKKPCVSLPRQIPYIQLLRDWHGNASVHLSNKNHASTVRPYYPFVKGK